MSRLATALILCGGILLMGVSVFASLQDRETWDKFKIEHDCRLTAHKPGAAMETAKDGWTCDDGKTYFR